MLQEKRQIGLAIEAVEGTPESLDAGDVILVSARETRFDANLGRAERDLLQASLSRHPDLTAVEGAALRTAVEVRGSGSLTTPPAFDVLVRICGMARSTLKKIGIGAITGGPFEHGETVTGGTSNATGRVIGRTATGATHLEIVVLTGTFQSAEVLTGGTSAATATTSSVVADGGYIYEPASSGVPSGTVACFHDGVKKLLTGVRGNLGFRGANAQVGMLTADLVGVYGDVTDVALLSGVTYETTLPPVLKGTSAVFGSYAPVLTNVEVDLANVVALRESMGAARGAVSARITGRNPTARLDPELTLVADFDYYGKLKDASTFYFEQSWGSTAGNRFKLIAPQAQISSVAEGDRNGISVAQLVAKLCGGTSYQDQELCLVCR
jgi:hypothetical protein